MPRLILLLAAVLFAVGCRSKPSALLPAGDQLRADVYWLADDARDGRLPGTPGADAAAAYVADRFAALGLKPAPGLRDFAQPFKPPARGRSARRPRSRSTPRRCGSTSITGRSA